MDKQTRKSNKKRSKHSGKKIESTGRSLCYWTFADIDRDGLFAFSVSRQDFASNMLFEKLLEYSRLTWNEIVGQTHDRSNKSKHHYLDYDGLSKAAQERIKTKHFEDDTDSIFSFALTNKIRVVGIRNGAEFKAIWYDPNHEFCPSHKS